MSRHLVFALCLMAAASLEAQERLTTIRVSTEPSGLRFYVDGQLYRNAQAFSWPAGSKHTLQVDANQEPMEGRRYAHAGWSDATGSLVTSSDTMVITADPSITSVKATFDVEYRLQVQFYTCTQPRQDLCQPPGRVSVNGTWFSSSVDQWVKANTTLQLVATPNPGFVFAGWGATGNYSQSSILNWEMRGAATFQGIFAGAKRVTLQTEPAELLVAPDGTPTKTPVTLDWGLDTRHRLGVVSPQRGSETTDLQWVFSHWSNGASENDVYVVKDANIPVTLTAKYVPGIPTAFVTEPSGLKLVVQGRDNWPSYNFVWGAGMTYRVSAPEQQTAANGRVYRFKGWSNGGPATQDLVLSSDLQRSGFRLVATYEPLSRLTIDTSPAGLPVTVNGTECRNRCDFDYEAGATVTIAAAHTLAMGDGAQMEFVGWGDGEPAERTVTLPQEGVHLVAHYKTRYRLSLRVEPADGVIFRTDPGSSDGYFDKDAIVSVTAQAKPGYRFRRWDGDLTGTYRTAQVQMIGPREARALVDTTPWADEAGVRNAAGDNGEAVVAPGSIAAVFGANLAGAYEAGPANPLAQAIGSVTLRLRDRLMPLVFVSPEQINFQTPSDLAEGEYTLALRWGTMPEITTKMRIVPNAPGLFHTKADGLSWAHAVREDGSAVDAGAPAARGEKITLFGTGFGRYDKPSLDGFAIPTMPPYYFTDTVEVFAGDRPLPVDFAGGLGGHVGIHVVRFEIPSDLVAPDGTAGFRVRVNGRDSNTVVVPIQP